jgi:hypothetical protein
MASSCKEKSGPQNRYTRKTCCVEVSGVKRPQCGARCSSLSQRPAPPPTAAHSRTGVFNYIISAYSMRDRPELVLPSEREGRRETRGRRHRLPSMSTLLPPSSSPPDLPGDGVFDDLPVDRKSCQLLGPTALVRTHSPAHLFWHLTQECF